MLSCSGFSPVDAAAFIPEAAFLPDTRKRSLVVSGDAPSSSESDSSSLDELSDDTWPGGPGGSLD